jgi:hypothetical protein
MKEKLVICKECGYVGLPVKKLKGSIWTEIILWLGFLIPGLIYSIWRLTTKHKACKKCGSPSVIPVDSPIGQKLLKEIKGDEEQKEREKNNPRAFPLPQGKLESIFSRNIKDR